MTLLLAPMEGVLDFTLRDVLTRAGGVDRCVSEFIRVTDQLLPERVFLRLVPELGRGGCTPAGVPVRPQLLGSDPACLADNAARLATLAPPGIDLNFGCPAKTVNRHRGGAVLLDEPALLHAIVRAVRQAVPAGMVVSAKMRLGVADDSRAEECARALAEGGVDELVVHARTKLQGYRPPAYWERIAAVREAVSVRVIANGDIWTLDDARRCRAISGCTDLMIGRGLLTDPGLARAIAADHLDGGLAWAQVAPLVALYWQRVSARLVPRHRGGRLKQWLQSLRRRHAAAQALYDDLRGVSDPAIIDALLTRHLDGVQVSEPPAGVSRSPAPTRLRAGGEVKPLTSALPTCP